MDYQKVILFPFEGNSQCNEVTWGTIGKPIITRISKKNIFFLLYLKAIAPFVCAHPRCAA